MNEEDLNKEFINELDKKIRRIKRKNIEIKILIVLIFLVICCFIWMILSDMDITNKVSNGDVEFTYDYPDIAYSFVGVSDNFGFKTGQINYSVENGILLVDNFYIKEDSLINPNSIETAEVKIIFSDETLKIREKLFDGYGLDTNSIYEYNKDEDGELVSWLNEVNLDWRVLHSCKDGTYSVEDCNYVIDHVPYDFPGDFKIEITYCYGEECYIEEFKLSELTIMEEE